MECIKLEKTHGVHRNDGPTFQVHGFASIAPVRRVRWLTTTHRTGSIAKLPISAPMRWRPFGAWR